MRRYQVYHSGYHGDQLTLRIVDLRRRTFATSHDLTPSSYARFVRLANSGAYSVSICEDAGHRIGWELRRQGGDDGAV